MGDVDARRVRGDRTRSSVAAGAAAIASVDGLAGMSIAQVGAALGVGKSSVQAAYGTKEAVQLAAVAAATQTFVGAVVAPALERPAGRPRLEALVEAWLSYVQRRVFPGGCFMVATLAEFDSRPGPVRDALAAARAAWLGLLEQEASVAAAAGDIPSSPPPDQLAFEIDAVLAAANIARNLADDAAPLAIARDLITTRLGPVPRRARRGRLSAG